MPVSRLLEDLFPDCDVLPPPPITRKTIELGSRNSPDFVCSPFKYNMGNYIEALEAGANVLLQTGLGCRFGYYGPVQEQILRDMGYDFEFLWLTRNKDRLKEVHRIGSKLNPKLTLKTGLHAALMAKERARIMDRLDYLFRERVGFEVHPGSFEREKKNMLAELMAGDTIPALHRIYGKYRDIYYGINTDIPENALRIGIVGELYTLMEPFSNHWLEKQLAKAGVSVSRKMNATFLLFEKHDRITLRKSGGYLQYTVGANGVDSVAQSRMFARRGYDGIIHIKSFGCTPELNAQPALMNMSRDLDIPMMHLSFDTQTSETGVQTRIEAFIDMIKMKRDQNHEENCQPWGGRGVHLHQRRFH